MKHTLVISFSVGRLGDDPPTKIARYNIENAELITSLIRRQILEFVREYDVRAVDIDIDQAVRSLS